MENHCLPMLDGWAGVEDWWADKDGTDLNYKWTFAPYSKDLVIGNYTSDAPGVQAQYGTLSSTDCNCDYGDYVATSVWDHVLLVVSLPDGQDPKEDVRW